MHKEETSKILRGLSKKYLVTGAAGFIASQVCSQLLDRGEQVVGVDNLNDYYDVSLKKWRLQQLENHRNAKNFYFEKLDIENQESLKNLFKNMQKTFFKVSKLVNLGRGCYCIVTTQFFKKNVFSK